MMLTYEVKDSDGRTYTMSGKDHEDVCRRVADLHGVVVVAWRQARFYVGPVHHGQVIG